MLTYFSLWVLTGTLIYLHLRSEHKKEPIESVSDLESMFGVHYAHRVLLALAIIFAPLLLVAILRDLSSKD